MTLATIDFTQLGAGGAAMDELAAACEDHGFFQLVNHGLSGTTRASFLAAMEEFFALPPAQKHALMRSADNPWGYYDQELTKNKRDWKEIFDLGIDSDDATFNSRSQWPPAMPAFRQNMLAWFEGCEAVSIKLLAAIAVLLGQESEVFHRHFKPVNTSYLRLNHYPLCDDPADDSVDGPSEGHLGISHHTDAGALTLLAQDQVAGLQMKVGPDWVLVEPEPDALVVNLGDMLQVWSNDRFKAPLHRVRANAAQQRYSAAFFLNPSFETDCMPLDAATAPRYRPINWGEFRAGRAAGDYADYGQEIQIANFRLQD
jgi:isopenicillin N synthase-like dioxygenase